VSGSELAQAKEMRMRSAVTENTRERKVKILSRGVTSLQELCVGRLRHEASCKMRLTMEMNSR
jgi:hypothetical protein